MNDNLVAPISLAVRTDWTDARCVTQAFLCGRRKVNNVFHFCLSNKNWLDVHPKGWHKQRRHNDSNKKDDWTGRLRLSILVPTLSVFDFGCEMKWTAGYVTHELRKSICFQESSTQGSEESDCKEGLEPVFPESFLVTQKTRANVKILIWRAFARRAWHVAPLSSFLSELSVSFSSLIYIKPFSFACSLRFHLKSVFAGSKDLQSLLWVKSSNNAHQLLVFRIWNRDLFSPFGSSTLSHSLLESHGLVIHVDSQLSE